MVAILRSLFGDSGRSKAHTAHTDAHPEGRAAPLPDDTQQTPGESAAVRHVSDDTFAEQVLAAKVPVLVDFWAEWCGPCRMIAPILDELADVYDGRVLFVKLDADENPATAQQMAVMGLPTLLLIKDGQEVDRVVGYAPRHVIQAKLDAVVAQG